MNVGATVSLLLKASPCDTVTGAAAASLPTPTGEDNGHFSSQDLGLKVVVINVTECILGMEKHNLQ